MCLIENLCKKEEINIILGDYFIRKYGMLSRKELARVFFIEFSKDQKNYIKDRDSFSNISQKYLDLALGTKSKLLLKLRDLYSVYDTQKNIKIPESTFYENIIVSENVSSIISFDYDFCFEKAHSDILNKVERVLPLRDKNKINLYKVFGDFSDLDSLMITNQDIRKYKLLDCYKPYFKTLCQELYTRKTVILGSDLKNPDICDMLDYVFSISDKEKLKDVYYFSTDKNKDEINYDFLEKNNIKILTSKEELYNEEVEPNKFIVGMKKELDSKDDIIIEKIEKVERHEEYIQISFPNIDITVDRIEPEIENIKTEEIIEDKIEEIVEEIKVEEIEVKEPETEIFIEEVHVEEVYVEKTEQDEKEKLELEERQELEIEEMIKETLNLKNGEQIEIRIAEEEENVYIDSCGEVFHNEFLQSVPDDKEEISLAENIENEILIDEEINHLNANETAENLEKIKEITDIILKENLSAEEYRKNLEYEEAFEEKEEVVLEKIETEVVAETEIEMEAETETETKVEIEAEIEMETETETEAEVENEIECQVLREEENKVFEEEVLETTSEMLEISEIPEITEIVEIPKVEEMLEILEIKEMSQIHEIEEIEVVPSKIEELEQVESLEEADQLTELVKEKDVHVHNAELVYIETAAELKLHSLSLVSNPIKFTNIYLGNEELKKQKLNADFIKVGDEKIFGVKLKVLTSKNIKFLEIKSREFYLKFGIEVLKNGDILPMDSYLEYCIFDNLVANRFEYVLRILKDIFYGKEIAFIRDNGSEIKLTLKNEKESFKFELIDEFSKNYGKISNIKEKRFNYIDEDYYTLYLLTNLERSDTFESWGNFTLSWADDSSMQLPLVHVRDHKIRLKGLENVILRETITMSDNLENYQKINGFRIYRHKKMNIKLEKISL